MEKDRHIVIIKEIWYSEGQRSSTLQKTKLSIDE